MSIFCRICRMQIFTQPVPLTGSSIRHAKPIEEMIFECTRILITKDNRLPQFLCETCLMRLDEAFTFLKLCRESERVFAETLPSLARTPTTTETGKQQQQQNQPVVTIPLLSSKPVVVQSGGGKTLKLELEPEEFVNPSFNALEVLIGAGAGSVVSQVAKITDNTNTGGTGSNGKDWIGEARKHRERQRLSTAKRRANMSFEQREKERERARIRQAQRRANRSEDEVRAQRERDRVRQAIKRAKFRQAEMIHQQQQQQQQQQQSQQHQTFSIEPGINQLMG